MTWFGWLLFAYIVAGTMAGIYSIGKQPGPVSAKRVFVVTVINILCLAWLVFVGV